MPGVSPPQPKVNDITPTIVDSPFRASLMKSGPPLLPLHGNLASLPLIFLAQSWLFNNPFFRLGWLASLLYFTRVVLHDSKSTINKFPLFNIDFCSPSTHEQTEPNEFSNFSERIFSLWTNTNLWYALFPSQQRIVLCHSKCLRFAFEYKLVERNCWIQLVYRVSVAQYRSSLLSGRTTDDEYFPTE